MDLNIDFSKHKVVVLRDVQEAAASGATSILVADDTVITPSTHHFLQQNKIDLVKSGKPLEVAAEPGSSPVDSGISAPTHPRPNPRLFNSPEAEAIKEEICAVGKKLWLRQYVDGNGGNISYRIGPNEIICTPTMVSKYDLTPEDLSLVDLEGNQIAGTEPRTSEIFLHLEVYKAVPEAKACVHCHPPHATAHAITGKVPPNGMIPEFEIFVGKVAIAPYATPGTAEFAQTVVPFVKDHNTILLANHGVLCWADTVTHAEWCVEVLETYCWTVMLAAQLGAPLTTIPALQVSELLARKKTLGLPDVRFDAENVKDSPLADPEMPNSVALTPGDGNSVRPARTLDRSEIEMLVKSITAAVLEAIAAK